MIKQLPPFKNVFFIHYQCQDFNEGDEIYSLCIYSEAKSKEYVEGTEAENIEMYCQKVKELCAKGLVPVHWNQNRSYFGVDHITARYKKITGKSIELDYPNEIGLSDILIDFFGDEYVSHPRLDNLAILNQCNGIAENEYRQRTFSVNRLLLISKIYHRLINGKLITELTQSVASQNLAVKEKKEIQNNQTKGFTAYLLHAQKEKLADSIRTEFSTEKSKSIRYLLEALAQSQPPLITIIDGEKKALYNSMKEYFKRDIGTYNSIFQCNFNPDSDPVEKQNLEKFKVRITHILDRL